MDHRERPAWLETRVRMGDEEIRVKRVLPVLPVLQDLQVPQVLLVLRVPEGSKVLQDREESRV